LDTIWKQKPESFEELSRGVALTQADFRGRLTAAQIADTMHDWRLLVVQFQTLDSLQHRCWNLLGLEGASGGSPRWTARLREALTTLDECVGELCDLAARRRAAVVVVSDHGFGPFREKISLAELLRKRDLIVPADAPRHALHWLVRKAWRAQRSLARRLHPGRSAAGAERPLGSLAPIDWRTSRAVALHGNLAALVYLNTAARFGAGPIVSADQYDSALAETIAAFAEARHPETGEALFVHVEATRGQLGCDPLERSWPDVVAIPADGFHTRPKFDRAWRLMVPDTKLTGTHRTSGVLMIDAPGVQLGHTHSAELRDVAPTILAMLGGRQPVSMTGRVLNELWTGEETPAEKPRATHLASAPDANHAFDQPHAFSATAQAQVESRLRELGYIE
jgi:predicted AlkP superfamily phosphohydrolase/phosphomutase